MASGFQTAVANQPAPAVAGDFASQNPVFTVDAGPNGLVAGPGGAVVGRFGWATAPADGDGFPSQVSNAGSGPVTGFLFREQQGLITAFLASSSMTVPQGFPLTLASGGDFWVKNDGATQALPGQKAYANFADGKVTFAATATPTAGGTSTASTIAAKTASFTGSIINDLLTTTGHSGDALVVGAILSSGSGVAAGTAIVSQVSGVAGGAGTYRLSIPEQSVAAEAMSFTYGLLTVGGTVAASYGVGSVLTGGGTAAGTKITALGTGTGGAGTYFVNLTQTVGSGAINVSAINVETKWVCMSSALAGELCKISSQPLG
jgi:hypothetical protein